MSLLKPRPSGVKRHSAPGSLAEIDKRHAVHPAGLHATRNLHLSKKSSTCSTPQDLMSSFSALHSMGAEEHTEREREKEREKFIDNKIDD
jgi:hypothetical protein